MEAIPSSTRVTFAAISRTAPPLTFTKRKCANGYTNTTGNFHHRYHNNNRIHDSLDRQQQQQQWLRPITTTTTTTIPRPIIMTKTMMEEMTTTRYGQQSRIIHHPCKHHHHYNHTLSHNHDRMVEKVLLPTAAATATQKKRDVSWVATSSADTIASLSSSLSPTDLHVTGTALKHRNLLVVIKQTAFEEYSQLKLRGQAPKAVRWKRLEQRYMAHKRCVTDLLAILHKNQVNFSCVNRVELDRQHLVNIDLMIAVGGDGTVLSAAHFLDHGTIPLLGINSDPNISLDDSIVIKKSSDERRSHGALCMCTAIDMDQHITNILHGNSQHHTIRSLNRIQCKVKSTFSETILVPALNDILIANPSPAAVSRFRMGWLNKIEDSHIHRNDNLSLPPSASAANSTTRFSGIGYNVVDSINVWSSGIWMSTATGSTAAMKASGGSIMDPDDNRIQYLIREHMIEQNNLQNLIEIVKTRRQNKRSNRNNNNGNDSNNEENEEITEKDINNGYIDENEKIHIRWNSQRGRIFIDGSHLIHNLELGDEILIDNLAPKLQMYTRI